MNEQERTEVAILESSLEYAKKVLSEEQYTDFKIEVDRKLEFIYRKHTF